MFPSHGVFISRLSRAKRLSSFLFKWNADIHCFCLQSLMTLLFLRCLRLSDPEFLLSGSLVPVLRKHIAFTLEKQKSVKILN